jgi:hypothetical protein
MLQFTVAEGEDGHCELQGRWLIKAAGSKTGAMAG